MQMVCGALLAVLLSLLLLVSHSEVGVGVGEGVKQGGKGEGGVSHTRAGDLHADSDSDVAFCDAGVFLFGDVNSIVLQGSVVLLVLGEKEVGEEEFQEF